MNTLKKLLADERGSVLPMIAVILILVILIGMVNFGLVVAYRDRAAVRNALDAGVTSALAKDAREINRAIIYGEGAVCVKKVTLSNWDRVIVEYKKVITGYKEVITGYKEEIDGYTGSGDPIYKDVPIYEDVPTYGWDPVYEWEYNPVKVCTVRHWRDTESKTKNYIQMPVGQASTTAQNYFEKNMDKNRLPGKVVNWNFEVTYDDERIYTVKKNRTIVPIRPAFEPGITPKGASFPGDSYDPGKPDIHNFVKNPKNWWFSDFGGANTQSWTMKPSWTDDISEERDIIFPRWLEVKANVEVEIPIPFGKYLGKESYTTSFETVAFKELVHVIP